MYCDDCGSHVGMDLHEYIKQKDLNGTVRCNNCTTRDDTVLNRVRRELGYVEAST